MADAEGNVVAVTYTLNGGYGSKVTATGLGFLLNNEMDDFAPKPGEAEYVRPDSGRGQRHCSRGKTPLSSMTPTIVLRDGKPVLALGSPGGPTIINTVLRSDRQRARFRHERAGRGELAALPPPVDARRTAHGARISRRTRSRCWRSAATIGERGRTRRAKSAAIRWNDGWLEGAPDPRTEGYGGRTLKSTCR